MPDLEAGLMAYLVGREQQRQQDIERAWEDLKADVGNFLARFHDNPNLPSGVAKLVWEMSVAAFVRGTMWAAGVPHHNLTMPTDSVMVYEARETTKQMPDIYPGFALLDGRDVEAGDV